MKKDPDDLALPTVHLVAREAGVSAATVSRFLNGTAKVSDAKRKSIEVVIDRLNYKPNVLAQNLKTGSSRTIGVLTQSLDSGYFTDAMSGIEEALKNTGYAPLIVSGHWHADEEAERIELLIARRVDGLIILTGRLTDDQIIAFSRRVPIMVFGRTLESAGAFGFCQDNYQAACDAVEYLLLQGHRQIAFIAGPPDHDDARARLAGYQDTLARHKIAANPQLIETGDFFTPGGLLALDRLFASGQRFTAIFAANDLSAYGARLGLYQRNIRVPEDISIIGFDDLPGSMFTTPPLTTVRQPLFEVGRCLGQAILKIIAQEPFTVDIPPLSLVLRDSVRRLAPAPA